MAAKTSKQQSIEPKSPAALEAFAAMIAQGDQAQFATDLIIARSMWRHYRAFVEGRMFPEPFRSAHKKEYDGNDPQKMTGCVEDWARANSPDLMNIALEEAREHERKWERPAATVDRAQHAEQFDTPTVSYQLHAQRQRVSEQGENEIYTAQEIDLTIAEYDALKAELVRMRKGGAR